MKGYYFITDSGLSCAGNISDVKQAEACSVCAVQYRNKKAETREMYEEAVRLREICRNALFLINDRIDIALAVDADGVHLGTIRYAVQCSQEDAGPREDNRHNRPQSSRSH